MLLRACAVGCPPVVGRYKAWPRVAAFIESLPRGSLIGDIGCGNGKNIPSCSEVGVALACDLSIELCKICRSMGFEVVCLAPLHPPPLCLSVSLSLSLSLALSLFLPVSLSLSFSLSLYIYIHKHTFVHILLYIYICIYIYIYTLCKSNIYIYIYMGRLVL